jgi:phosphohistidine phosphatase
MIELYILRHAVAESRETWAPRSERERPLTRKGEKEMFRVAKGMKKLDLGLDLILSSPFVRAKRTAEIAAEVLRLEKKLKFSERLGPEAEAEALIPEARRLFGSARKVLLVGHEPFLSELISLLVSGDAAVAIKLRKAGLCKISLDAVKRGGGILEWLLTPGQLLRIR